MRIEFECTEQKMDDLKGFYKMYINPEKNPYTVDKLDDDEFNFVSGVNFAISYLTDAFLANYMLELEAGESIKGLLEIKKDIAKATIKEFADYGFEEIADIITSFIDEHEEEE